MTKEVLIDGVKIRYSERGVGTPVVLLHGYLLSLEVWGRFAEGLAEKYRVICIDIPGHGASGVYGETHTMDHMAEIINKVLEQIMIEKCILVGHSMGGYITLAFLDKFPEKLIAFSLFHSTPFADSDEKKQNRDREIELVKAGKKESVYSINIPKMFADDNLFNLENEVEFAKQLAKNNPDEGIVALLRGMKERPDRLMLLKHTTIPYLLVLGKKDNYIPYGAISERIGIPRNITKLILEGSGHIGYIEELEKSVLGFYRFIDDLEK